MSIKDGGPAFPIPSEEMRLHGQSVAESQGMSLRDYFAAKAMASFIITRQMTWDKYDEEDGSDPNSMMRLDWDFDGGTSYFEDDAAVLSYSLADAMLRAREAK